MSTVTGPFLIHTHTAPLTAKLILDRFLLDIGTGKKIKKEKRKTRNNLLLMYKYYAHLGQKGENNKAENDDGNGGCVCLKGSHTT